MTDSIIETNHWIALSQLLLNSFERFLDRPLVSRDGRPHEQAERLFQSPSVVVAHGTQVDPILCFANQAALDLWETDLSRMLKMPSRETAEPMERSERAKMLERGRIHGYIDDYQGIRITTTGKRFHIRNAIIWNLIDETETQRGQAATFSDWEFIPS